MRDYDEQTAFLRRMLSYDESAESQKIADAITRVQQDQACVLKALCGVGLIDALFVALSQADFIQADPAIRLRIVCVGALAGVICLLAFAGVLLFYRWKLNGLRDKCRHLIGGWAARALGEKPFSRGSLTPKTAECNHLFS